MITHNQSSTTCRLVEHSPLPCLGLAGIVQTTLACGLLCCAVLCFVLQAIHPEGSCVLTSSRAGKLSLWDISGLDTSAAAAVAAGSAGAEVCREAWLAADHPDSAVDCIRFLTGEGHGFWPVCEGCCCHFTRIIRESAVWTEKLLTVNHVPLQQQCTIKCMPQYVATAAHAA